MLTSDDLQLITRLKGLDKAAKKAPWYPQGAKSNNKAVYRIGPNEEALIIALRNHIGDLLHIIERKSV